MRLDTAVAALLGLGVGVVLNVFADRLPRGRSGRTSDRRSGVLRSALFVICGGIFAYLHSRHGWSSAFLIQATYISLLMLIAVIDFEHSIVPNVLVGTGMVLALCFGILQPSTVLGNMLWGAAIGGGTFALLAAVGRGALGMGDVKLAALIGMMTGYPWVLQALTLGVVLGGLAAAVALVTRLRTRKQYMPYAPYLVAGSLLTLVDGPRMADWYGRLMAGGG